MVVVEKLSLSAYRYYLVDLVWLRVETALVLRVAQALGGSDGGGGGSGGGGGLDAVHERDLFFRVSQVRVTCSVSSW